MLCCVRVTIGEREVVASDRASATLKPTTKSPQASAPAKVVAAASKQNAHTKHTWKLRLLLSRLKLRLLLSHLKLRLLLSRLKLRLLLSHLKLRLLLSHLKLRLLLAKPYLLIRERGFRSGRPQAKPLACERCNTTHHNATCSAVCGAVRGAVCSWCSLWRCVVFCRR